ncbi:MAG: hypothetical protein BGO77_04470 [Caedibacter sp. 37-49]|nr:MAG: hypothetical protein BGO77_04470 [Caedibacter sp. 37-49]
MFKVNNHAELIFLIKKLQEGEGTDEEVAHWFKTYFSDCPGIFDLIFHSKEELSPEEILNLAREKNKIID